MDELKCPECGKTSQPIDDEHRGLICGHCGYVYKESDLEESIPDTLRDTSPPTH